MFLFSSDMSCHIEVSTIFFSLLFSDELKKMPSNLSHMCRITIFVLF